MSMGVGTVERLNDKAGRAISLRVNTMGGWDMEGSGFNLIGTISLVSRLRVIFNGLLGCSTFMVRNECLIRFPHSQLTIRTRSSSPKISTNQVNY